MSNDYEGYDKYISDSGKTSQDEDYGSYESYLSNSRVSNDSSVGEEVSEIVSDKREAEGSENDITETDHGGNTGSDDIASADSSQQFDNKLLSTGGSGPSEVGKGTVLENAAGIASGAGNAVKGFFGGMLGGGLSAVKSFFKAMTGKSQSMASQLGVPVQAVVAIFSLVTGISTASLFAMFGGGNNNYLMSDPLDDCVVEEYKWQENNEYSDIDPDANAKTIYETLDGAGFSPEATAAIISNCVAESGVNPARFEMDYRAGSNADAEYITLARTHHRNWDEYVTFMFDVYADDGMSINESAYEYLEISGTYDQKYNQDVTYGVGELDESGNEIQQGTVIATHLYPGVGILQWTGPRAYKLQCFADTLENPRDNNLDGHNDAMYTLQTQLAFLIVEENQGLGSYGSLTGWGVGNTFSYSFKSLLPDGTESEEPYKDGDDWVFPVMECRSALASSEDVPSLTMDGEENVTVLEWDDDYQQGWIERREAEQAAYDAWQEAHRAYFNDEGQPGYHNSDYWDTYTGYSCNEDANGLGSETTPCGSPHGHAGQNCDQSRCPDNCPDANHQCGPQCNYPGQCKKDHVCDTSVCTSEHHPTQTYYRELFDTYKFGSDDSKTRFSTEYNAYIAAQNARIKYQNEVIAMMKFLAQVENGGENAKACAKQFCEEWVVGPDLDAHVSTAASYYAKMMEQSRPKEPGAPDDAEVDTSGVWKSGSSAYTSMLNSIATDRTNARLYEMRISESAMRCGGGNFNNASIAACAVSWAFPQVNGVEQIQYCDIDAQVPCCAEGLLQTKCTSLYVAVKNVVAPQDTHHYSSCDRGMATAILASGSDDNFPMGACAQQLEYLQSSSNWQFVTALASPSDFDQLEPGDLIVSDHHVMVFVGGELAAEKWPDLYTAEEARYGIVHSSHSNTYSTSRGPRFDPDGRYWAGQDFVVYRCTNTNQDSSEKKALVDALDFSAFHDGSEPAGSVSSSPVINLP